MKPLSSTQVSLAKSPDGRLGNPADNYANILSRVRDSFRDLTDVTKILPDIEKHVERYKGAKQIYEQFTIENFEPILKKLFPTREQEGASFDDSILFNPKKMSGERIKLASYLLKFASDYLLQAFPGGQFDYLKSRINDVVTEIKGMQTTFDNTKMLYEQIESYREHTETFVPVILQGDESNYTVLCEYCRVYDFGHTVKEAITKVRHKPKCKYLEDKTDVNLNKVAKWFKIVPPREIRDQYAFN